MKEDLVISYQELFNTDNGKKVLKDLERQTRYHKNAFNPESDRITNYNLGCQWVVQYIHSVMDKSLFEETKDEVINKGINI